MHFSKILEIDKVTEIGIKLVQCLIPLTHMKSYIIKYKVLPIYYVLHMYIKYKYHIIN